MLTKLLSLLTTAKGAAAVAVLAAATATTGVVATNTDLQTTLGIAHANASPSGQPAIVAARNDADKTLREAFQADQRTLEHLRSTHVDGADRQKLGDTVSTADAALRARFQSALDAVGALTLGRNGREASASPEPSDSTASTASSESSESAAGANAALSADVQARIDDIVKTAVADMAKIVSDAEAAVSALPTANPGKPSDLPGGKPSDVQGGKPSDVPGASDHPTPPAPSAKPTR